MNTNTAIESVLCSGCIFKMWKQASCDDSESLDLELKLSSVLSSPSPVCAELRSVQEKNRRTAQSERCPRVAQSRN